MLHHAAFAVDVERHGDGAVEKSLRDKTALTFSQNVALRGGAREAMTRGASSAPKDF